VGCGYSSVTTRHTVGRVQCEGWLRGYTKEVALNIRLLGERRYDPPRTVEVEQGGRWMAEDGSPPRESVGSALTADRGVWAGVVTPRRGAAIRAAGP
jgi:hypothetical protein